MLPIYKKSRTDLRYIQEILGRSCSKTTEIYTDVSIKKHSKKYLHLTPYKQIPTFT